jgi:ferredoxin
MQVRVDEKKCCGAGQCVLVAPEVFDQRDDGIVVLLKAAPPERLHAAVREAVGVCPGYAIQIDE